MPRILKQLHEVHECLKFNTTNVKLRIQTIKQIHELFQISRIDTLR